MKLIGMKNLSTMTTIAAQQQDSLHQILSITTTFARGIEKMERFELYL